MRKENDELTFEKNDDANDEPKEEPNENEKKTNYNVANSYEKRINNLRPNFKMRNANTAVVLF